LDTVLEALYKGRHYFWIGLYLSTGERLERHGFRGPQPKEDGWCRSIGFNEGNVGTVGARGTTKLVSDVSADAVYRKCLDETQSELTVPIKIGVHVLGVINVENDRRNALGNEDRVLIEQVAARVARYLESSGRYLLRRVREATALSHARGAGS